MSNAMIIKKKEAVEAEMNREAQARAEGRVQDEIRERKAKEEENEKVPPYVKYFAIYDKKNRHMASIEHLDNTNLRPGKVKRDLKEIREQFFIMRHDLKNPEVQELKSSLHGYGWLALCNKKELKMFLLYSLESRKTDVRSFVIDLNGVFEKIDGQQKIRKNIKKLLMGFLQKKAGKQDTSTKIDKLLDQTNGIKQKLTVTMGKMTSNFENVHNTGIVAEKLKQEAAKLKDQAMALADETSSTSMVTIIIILVGCLLLIAVIGNLYVQIKAPPPKHMKAGASTHFVRNFSKKGWKVLKTIGRATEYLFRNVKNTFNSRSKRLRGNNQNQRHSKAHQRAIRLHLAHRKRKIKKKLKPRRIKTAHKMDLTYSSVFKKKKIRNMSFSLSDYLTEKVANSSKRESVDQDSIFKRGRHLYNSKVSFLI